MVECMFIWLHNISSFTWVNVFYNYGWVKEQESLNLSSRESSRFYGTMVDSNLPTYLGIWFYKFFGFVNVSIFFTSSYSQVKSISNFLSLLD